MTDTPTTDVDHSDVDDGRLSVRRLAAHPLVIGLALAGVGFGILWWLLATANYYTWNPVDPFRFTLGCAAVLVGSAALVAFVGGLVESGWRNPLWYWLAGAALLVGGIAFGTLGVQSMQRPEPPCDASCYSIPTYPPAVDFAPPLVVPTPVLPPSTR